MVKITIDNKELDLGEIDKLSLGLSYSIEDQENFQQKNGSKALSVIVPASVINDQIANTAHNPGIEDLTKDEIYKGMRKAVIEVNGQELLTGKAKLNGSTHTDKPESYEFDFYGHNSDWLIDLKETTLYDILKDIVFQLSKQGIIDSWSFDGTDETKPYVFAPVKYGQQMEDFHEVDPVTGLLTGVVVEDADMKPEYMRPALSKYWIIHKAFKALGYRVESEFFDTDYFRRQVMPWTWGNFLSPSGKLDDMDFLAKSSPFTLGGFFQDQYLSDVKKFTNKNIAHVENLNVTNTTTNGAFDPNGVYSYDPVTTLRMRWTYLPTFASFGLLEATFHMSIFADVTVSKNSHVRIRVQWFKNGLKINHGNDNGYGTLVLEVEAPAVLGSKMFAGNVEDWATFTVEPGDIIEAAVFVEIKTSTFGSSYLGINVDAFELDYFRTPLGGVIKFDNYATLKKHKFLDFFAGVVDEFNLCMQTDPTNKVVYIEPQHPYALGQNQALKQGGYFNEHTLNWENKQDLTKESSINIFSDYERELEFKYRDDNNDGTFNILKARNGSTPGLAKYVFPDRFKVGKKQVENRFFSPAMHWGATQWMGLGSETGEFPMMICLVPENISNTSRDEAQNTFEPKSAYYKGIISEVGWIFDGVKQTNFPYMFAVNYRPGGEDDPVLSYCDEEISPGIIAPGLLRRFYLQRMEIIRNGQYYSTWFRLNNNDITNFLHREYIVVRGQKWELVDIDNYLPLNSESTKVLLRKWVPVYGR